MERFRELVSFITDLSMEDGRYTEAYLDERKIDHKRFKDRIMEYLEKRREAEMRKGGVRSKK